MTIWGGGRPWFAAKRRYVFGPGIDEPLVWYEGTGTGARRFLAADERGSVISMTSSNGTALGTNRYDEFGQPQSTNTGKWGYTGQDWLPEAGAWYYKARLYEPELGRFLQTDPIGYAGGVNLYAYVRNDPVNFIDPLGLAGLCVAGATFETGEYQPGDGRPGPCPGDDPFADLMPRWWRMHDLVVVNIGGGGDGGPNQDRADDPVGAVTDAVCDALAEGETPVQILTAAAGGLAGYLTDKVVTRVTSTALRRAEISKPVIGSRVVPGEVRSAMRASRAGLVGAAAGLAVGIIFEDEIDESVKNASEMCKSILRGKNHNEQGKLLSYTNYQPSLCGMHILLYQRDFQSR